MGFLVVSNAGVRFLPVNSDAVFDRMLMWFRISSQTGHAGCPAHHHHSGLVWAVWYNLLELGGADDTIVPVSDEQLQRFRSV